MFRVKKQTPLTDKIIRFCDKEDIYGRKGLPGMNRKIMPGLNMTINDLETASSLDGVMMTEYLQSWYEKINKDTFIWEWDDKNKGNLILKLGRVEFYEKSGELLVLVKGYTSPDIEFEYFQPMYKEKHHWCCPVFSFQAFETFEEARAFLEKEGLDVFETKIERYADQEIEQVSIIDRNRKRLR